MDTHPTSEEKNVMQGNECNKGSILTYQITVQIVQSTVPSKRMGTVANHTSLIKSGQARRFCK